jgi:hypothetical protein
VLTSFGRSRRSRPLTLVCDMSSWRTTIDEDVGTWKQTGEVAMMGGTMWEKVFIRDRRATEGREGMKELDRVKLGVAEGVFILIRRSLFHHTN